MKKTYIKRMKTKKRKNKGAKKMRKMIKIYSKIQNKKRNKAKANCRNISEMLNGEEVTELRLHHLKLRSRLNSLNLRLDFHSLNKLPYVRYS
jgi:hypothetical protein